ncbi:hypothetical protein BZG21_47440, partial [Escherichia coli]|nr:hypothetical protein [Escherichia coli]
MAVSPCSICGSLLYYRAILHKSGDKSFQYRLLRNVKETASGEAIIQEVVLHVVLMSKKPRADRGICLILTRLNAEITNQCDPIV